MYIWKNKGRRDRRNHVTDGAEAWVAPKDTHNMDENDEKIRTQDESIFIAAYVRRLRQQITKYLTTPDGAMEANHVINEIEKIHQINEAKAGSVSIPEEVKKKDNVYQIFRTFDTDGSGTIDLDELDVLLRHLGVQLEKDDLDSLLLSLDLDGEGEIDFEEFYVWFLAEVEVAAASSKKKKSFNPFARKNKSKRDGLGAKFKRMTQEIAARNLIIDKLLHETEHDLRLEFRIAHPPLFACDIEHCHKCFTTEFKLLEHKEDSNLHTSQRDETMALLETFAAVSNAFLGPAGRKLTAHRLLFSTDLNGLAFRRNNLVEMPYRPMLSDPKGVRKAQLAAGNLVVGADPKAGVRGLPRTNNRHRQHCSTWLRDHQMSSVADTRTLMKYAADHKIDTVVTSEFGAIAEVKLVYSKFIRWSIFVKGEFTDWKPERLIADAGGKYCFMKKLSPGRYRYRFVADDVDCVEETSSQLTDEWGHNNIVQVLNPLDIPSEGKPVPTTVNLRNSNLCDDGVWAVFGGVQPSATIEVIDLSNNGISDDGLMGIAEGCKALSRLKELRLNGNGFTFEGVKHLEVVIRESACLQSLELSNNRLGDDGAEAIGKYLQHHSSVRDLYLDSNFINYHGCDSLGGSLHTMRNLRTLSLAGNIIRTPAAERLSHHLRINGGLTSLNISKNPLGPDGVARIGELLYETANLTHLDLSSTQMMLKDKRSGLISICSGIKRNKSVAVLKLKSNGITNDNILDIAYALHQNRTIIALNLEFNQLATQWFEPNTYVKTKLLAKMPTITTTLDRNNKIQGDPELFARYIHHPKEWPEDPSGEWNDKRKWKVGKKTKKGGKKDKNMSLEAGVEGERKRLEEEYIRAELFKYAVTIGTFLRSDGGMQLIKHIAEVARQYAHALLASPDKQPEWMKGCHVAVVSALLTCHLPDTDPPLEGVVMVDGENNTEFPVLPPTVHEEYVQHVAGSRLSLLFKSLGITGMGEQDMKRFHAAVAVNSTATAAVAPVAPAAPAATVAAAAAATTTTATATSPAATATATTTAAATAAPAASAMTTSSTSPTDTVAIRKVCRQLKSHAHELSSQQKTISKLFRKKLLKLPLDAAKHLLYEQGLYQKRIELRSYYRSRPLQEPRFLCVQCGKRFESERLLRKHDDRKRKEHNRLGLMEELFTSQCTVIRRAKFLLTGVFFPAYYELNNSLLLPRYYCPQVFDTWGEGARPVAVIEPDMTYQVKDMMGHWLQVSYAGTLGWTLFKHGSIDILKPVFKDEKGFWDALEVFTTPVYYQVSELLPGHVEIKVRVKPAMSARVIASLEKGMVVRCEAELNGWLQIRYENFDAVWVLQKSGDIPLMEKLHPLNQNKFANIMHTSPSAFAEEDFELKADDLYNYLDDLKKAAREEERAEKERERRSLLRQFSGNNSDLVDIIAGVK